MVVLPQGDASAGGIGIGNIVRVTYRYVRPLSVLYARALGPYDQSTPQAWATMAAWLDQHNARRLVKRAYGFIRDNPRTTPPELAAI